MTVIKMGEALERLDNDAEIYIELIGTYIKMCEADIAELVAKHSGGDAARVQFLAHKIKGASMTVGAEDLAKVSAQIELALKANPSADVGLGVASIASVFADTERELVKIRDTLQKQS